jgi:hypothetical protein
MTGLSLDERSFCYTVTRLSSLELSQQTSGGVRIADDVICPGDVC